MVPQAASGTGNADAAQRAHEHGGHRAEPEAQLVSAITVASTARFLAALRA
jgi:hypothetical protein